MSKLLERVNNISENYKVETAHVDGTHAASYRAGLLKELRDAQSREGSSYIVSNAQVFGEGIDVPSLDAVAFLEVKHSFVDVVQAVGRVMRTCDGKKKGYIFVPVLVSEEAKNNGDVFDKSQYKAIGDIVKAIANIYGLCIHKDGDADDWKEVQEEFDNNIKASLHLLPESRDRRQLINHLYEKFFVGISNTVGLELQTENGVVYTPLEVADFMVRSADKLLRDELGTDGIGGQKVTVFDPFTGSGTFLGRMLNHAANDSSSSLKRLARLATGGMWAADDIIMPVYMAEAHVTSMLAELSDNRLVHDKFDYIIFGNSFSMDDRRVTLEAHSLSLWNAGIEHKRKLEDQRFNLIIMNPPYVKSLRSEQYVDQRVRETFAAKNRTQLRPNDYIRALRWSTDFLQSKDSDGEHGYLIAVICPDTWTNAQSGIQFCIAREFDKIWHIETRRSQKFSGDPNDGFGIFDSNCAIPIGIFFLCRLSKTHKDYTGDKPARLFYFRFPDVPEGMPRTEHPYWKRQILDNQHPDYDATDCTTLCVSVKMNAPDSWYAKAATKLFKTLPVLVDGKEKDISIFDKSTTGADIRKPTRWCNTSDELLIETLKVAEEKHKGQIVKVVPNPDKGKICKIQRKPLFDSVCYWDLQAWRQFDSHPNQSLLPEIFPTPDTDNIVLGFNRQNVISEYYCLAVNTRFAVSAVSRGVPRWLYSSDGSRRSNMTTAGLAYFRNHYKDIADAITEDTLFSYCFAVMSHPDYIAAHEMYLRQNPPRIPLQTDFHKWVTAGAELIKIHTQWQTHCLPYAGLTFSPAVIGEEFQSLVAATVNRRTDLNREDVQQAGLVYNGKVRITGFPSGAWDWKLGGAGNSIKAFCNKEMASQTSAADFIGRNGGDVLDALKRLVTASIRIGEIYRELEYVDV